MKKKMSLFDEKNYNSIIKEYGASAYAVIHNATDLNPCIIQEISEDNDWKIAVTCSGILFEDKIVGFQRKNSIDKDEKHIVPANSQIILVRYFRECNHNGILHYNVNDQLIYPCKDGKVYRISRKDAPDHYLDIIGASSLTSIGSAYSLPIQEHGAIADYKKNGAIYPVHAYHAD